MLNLREQILAAEDIRREPVEIPEWGVTLHVTTMSGIERDAFESACLGDDGRMDKTNIRAKLAIFTVVDSDGRRVFGDNDAELLGGKSAAALDRIFPIASKLNRLSKQDVEELAGNSESGRGAASPSA